MSIGHMYIANREGTLKPRVSITRISNCDFDKAVREAVELAGGLTDLVKSDSHVVVKPNLARMAPSGSGEITDARATAAVTKLVLDLHPASVVIAEGTAVGYDDGSLSTEEAFDFSGTRAVAQSLGVQCVNLNQDQPVAVPVPEPRAADRLLIARTIVESDVVVSVPVLKTHNRTNATISLKNMWGCVVGLEKRAGHMLGINNTLVDYFSVFRPTYTVIDANTAMEGLWRSPQDAVMMGLILAGKDALAADLVGCALMGIHPFSVFYLRELTSRPGEVHGLSDVEVVGESIAAHAQQFRPAFEVYMERYPHVRLVTGPSFCGGCVAELVSALTYMHKAGYGEQMKGLTIVVGEPEEDVELQGNVVVVGECSAAFEDAGPLAPGCPPAEDDVLMATCDAVGADYSLVMAVRDEKRREMWESTLDKVTG
jgi:uncharacterized protein (DUF362 family)